MKKSAQRSWPIKIYIGQEQAQIQKKIARKILKLRIDSQVSSDPYANIRYGRRIRIGLIVLLLVTVLFASGAFWVKYKLEGLRAVVEQEVQSRTGARLQAGAVLVNGLRGLRIDEVQLSLNAESGPSFQCWAPVAYVYINIVELLYGHIAIDRIEADQSKIQISRAGDRQWLTTDSFDFSELTHLMATPSFRLMGKDGSLEIVNVVGESRFDVRNFSFDISRLTGSPDFTAKLSGTIGKATAGDFKVDLRYTSIEDFDLRLQCAQVTADDLAVLFPASQQFIQSGAVSPTLRIAGYPDMTLVLAFEAPFEEVAIRNQPAFISPVTGTLRGVAQYNADKHILALTAVKVESNQLGGSMEGSISFAKASPVFNLRLESLHVPLKDAINYSMAGKTDSYGTLNMAFQEPCQLQVLLQGTAESPIIAVQGDVPGGTFTFTPKDDKTYPKGQLNLGHMTLSWNSHEKGPVGSFAITGGTLTHTSSGIAAEKVTGTLTLDENMLSVDPFNAEVTGNTFTGTLKYDLHSQRLELETSGILGSLENTFVGKQSDLPITGSMAIRGKLIREKQRCVWDGELDATQTEVRWPGWFTKTAGIGASAKKIHGEYIEGKRLSFSADTTMASSHAVLEGRLERQKEWRLTALQAKADTVDVAALGKCLEIPYRVSGGNGHGGVFEYVRDGVDERQWHLSGNMLFDELALLPEGGETPLHCWDLNASINILNMPNAVGSVTLAARKADMPPLRGSVWFPPLKPEQKNKTDVDRHWTFSLTGKDVAVPPWKGHTFTGKAFVNKKTAGFESYAAELEGGGNIQGKYTRQREENIFEIGLKWNKIPASYLLDQLRYPHVVSGCSTGEIQYSLDRDDPRTLNGSGRFSVEDGQFSADFLISQLEGKLRKSQITGLPVSLHFEHLESNILLEKDIVKTSDMHLEAPGVRVTGEGSFVTHGDMDYDLKVALSPDLAEQIPAIRDNLNVAGLRMAQQDVEIAFKVKGPTFNPTSELTQAPPVGVTVMSSALELTNDAMHVIDIPRKVLVDLLRIGGGIVGMSK